MPVDVGKTASFGAAANLAAGHAVEMSGAALGAAGSAVGCSVATAVGSAVASAGRAWSDKAVEVASRDCNALGGKNCP